MRRHRIRHTVLIVSISNNGTTSTNIAGYFGASGATNNYGIIVSVWRW